MVDFFVRRRGRMNGKGGERDVEEDTKRSDYLTLPAQARGIDVLTTISSRK